MNVLEQAVEGVKEATGLAAQKVLEHIPGTAEHAVRRDAKQLDPETSPCRSGAVRFKDDVQPSDEKRKTLTRQNTPFIKPGQHGIHTLEDEEYTKGSGMGLGPSRQQAGAGVSTWGHTVEDMEYSMSRPPLATVSSPRAQQAQRAAALGTHTVEDIDFGQGQHVKAAGTQRDTSVHDATDYAFYNPKA
ncbi:hypothetical protein N2152v2_008127 [Parachlorella kessleri]